MHFKQVKNPITGEVQGDLIEYHDDSGEIWVVSEGHRFWDLYQEWLAEGNTPQST